jgi:hypothetical protein
VANEMSFRFDNHKDPLPSREHIVETAPSEHLEYKELIADTPKSQLIST